MGCNLNGKKKMIPSPTKDSTRVLMNTLVIFVFSQGPAEHNLPLNGWVKVEEHDNFQLCLSEKRNNHFQSYFSRLLYRLLEEEVKKLYVANVECCYACRSVQLGVLFSMGHNPHQTCSAECQ